jgi:hypothetical protein
VLIVMNSFEGPVDFTLPKIENGEAWSLLADTNMEDCKTGEDFAIAQHVPSDWPVTFAVCRQFGTTNSPNTNVPNPT